MVLKKTSTTQKKKNENWGINVVGPPLYRKTPIIWTFSVRVVKYDCGIAPPYRRTHACAHLICTKVYAGVVLLYRSNEHRHGCVCKAGQCHTTPAYPLFRKGLADVSPTLPLPGLETRAPDLQNHCSTTRSTNFCTAQVSTGMGPSVRRGNATPVIEDQPAVADHFGAEDAMVSDSPVSPVQPERRVRFNPDTKVQVPHPHYTRLQQRCNMADRVLTTSGVPEVRVKLSGSAVDSITAYLEKR
jgi:hypothetical protein